MAMAIMSSRLLVAAGPRGFVPSAWGRTATAEPEVEEQPPAPDPLEDAFARGLAEGEAQARARYEGQLAELEQRYAGLESGFAELACHEEERLRAALRETVAALCEATLQPLALDAGALAARVERAAALLQRASDERRVRLHPDDLALVRAAVSPSLVLEADPALARGSLRIETVDGGIEDCPETWRAAIREALGLC